MANQAFLTDECREKGALSLRMETRSCESPSSCYIVAFSKTFSPVTLVNMKMCRIYVTDVKNGKP